MRELKSGFKGITYRAPGTNKEHKFIYNRLRIADTEVDESI